VSFVSSIEVEHSAGIGDCAVTVMDGGQEHFGPANENTGTGLRLTGEDGRLARRPCQRQFFVANQ